MPIVYTFYDLVQELTDLVAARFSSETICLFQGNHTPGQGDTTFSYLGVEANFGGYTRQVPTWSTPALNSDSVAQTASNVLTWSPSSTVNLPETISGVFALDAAGQLAWAELLPGGPVTLTAAGQTVSYQAVVSVGEEP